MWISFFLIHFVRLRKFPSITAILDTGISSEIIVCLVFACTNTWLQLRYRHAQYRSSVEPRMVGSDDTQLLPNEPRLALPQWELKDMEAAN